MSKSVSISPREPDYAVALQTPRGRHTADRRRAVPPRADRRRAPINFLAGFMGDPETEARAHLSQEAAQRAINEGRTMSVDAALALAVGEDATSEAPRDPA